MKSAVIFFLDILMVKFKKHGRSIIFSRLIYDHLRRLNLEVDKTILCYFVLLLGVALVVFAL